MRQSLMILPLLLFPTLLNAAEISGDYIESRTCDVYTGPCFANAEMDLAGKEALMAWKVDQGSWNGVSLDGLGVALVLTSDQTLGNDGVFAIKPANTQGVILVDNNATQEQRAALISFAKDSSKELSPAIQKVVDVPIKLTNNYFTNKGVLEAGTIAKIETRELTKADCVCTNEMVFYKPLSPAQNIAPAYSVTLSYTGKGLANRWTSHHLRSSFLGTFSR